MPTPAPSPGPTAAPQERVFSFDDGALTIIAPPGALAPETELVATARGPEDRPPELADVTFSGTFYGLEPDGLTFPEPITIIRRVALADLGADAPGAPLPIITLALRTSDGSWSWLENQTLLSDGEYLYLSGEATHTSQVLGFGGSNEVQLTGWALDDDEVTGIDVLADGVPVGRTFYGHSSVSAPLDAPSVPVINLDNPLGVSPALRQRYEQLFPEQFSEPFTHTGVLAENVEVHNTSNWSELPRDERASAFPSSQHNFQCIAPGHFNTVTGYEVGGLGAGSPLWTRLSLDEPSTTLMFPLAGDCIEPVDNGVQVGSVCLITVHTARGTYISYMRGLIELIEAFGGPKVVGVDVTLGGANDGQPAAGEQQAGNVWEFISGLHNAGKKKIEQVLVHLANGETVDVTDVVIGLLGGDTINVPFPGEPTFGTCP